MINITTPDPTGEITFATTPQPLLDTLGDTYLVWESLARILTGGEVASFLDFLARHDRFGSAIYLAWAWVQHDEDTRLTVSEDGTTMTIYNADEFMATLVDPTGIAQHLPSAWRPFL